MDGIYDGIGNVLEWCWDTDDVYVGTGRQAYKGAAVRGAACCFSDTNMTVDSWQVCNVEFRVPNIGIRMARTITAAVVAEVEG